jgi:hypothetical protein
VSGSDPSRTYVAGLAAGCAGTVVMTATTRLERRALGVHHPVDYDDAPIIADLVERWTPLSLSRSTAPVVNQVGRFSYGSAAGVLRGLLDRRVRHPAVVFFGVMWVGEAVALRALGVAPAPWRWRPRWLASSMGQHVVYAVATDATWRALVGHRSGGGEEGAQ